MSVIISRLLGGSVTQEDGGDNKAQLTEMMQLGSIDDSNYLEKFKNCQPTIPKPLNLPWHRSLLRGIRILVAKLVNQPLHPLFETDFSIPSYPPVDIFRFHNPAPIRDDVKPIDEYGADEKMMELCKEVVEKYSFLLENNPMCPNLDEEGKQDWVKELHSHSFPNSISELKLNERNKIGYTFKCLGAGLYLGTRKIPKEMTSAEFYENLITQLVLETGDADTNCAVAGALLGCRLGKSGLPKPWVDGLRHKDFVENISNNLCEIILRTMKET